MNYWFVVHDLKTYRQKDDFIECKVRERGVKEPKFRQFADIQIGDQIVYYAKGDMVVVGIFKVVSEMRHWYEPEDWREVMHYRIEATEMPPEGFYLDFKKVVHSESVRFDVFPIKEKWGVHLRGKTCIKLTERDYSIIKDHLKNPEYLIGKGKLKVKTKEISETLHELISESLMTIGEIFGFEPVRKPNVNQLRPVDQPFKAKGKTLDLAWRAFGLTWIPFEIQVHGSVPDLIYRLNLVHQWSLKIVIVADYHFHKEIREATQIYPFAEKLILLTPKEIQNAAKDLFQLKNLRQKIFLS